MKIQCFTLRVRHDAGIISIRTVASSVKAARSIVINAERCPESAIRRVYQGKVLYQSAA